VVLALMVGLIGGAAGTALVFGAREGWFETDIGGLDDRTPLARNNVDIAKVAELLLPSTVQILADGKGDRDASGSGFVVDREGHVITNNHVVADATSSGQLTVVDFRGNLHEAKIVGRSTVYDVAVLAVTGIEGLPPVALGSSKKMSVGDSVVALGSPLGLSSTVTSGIVSALDRPVTTGPRNSSSYINAVQTDAAINPGNSGGPLVNMRGQVIGVNSAIATVGEGSAAGNIGVGFAIPMEQVLFTATQIIDTGEAKYPVIGATVDTGSRKGGALVVAVPDGTPADLAGMRKGDVIVGLDDWVIRDGISLIVLIRSQHPGDTVTVTVRRDGEEIDLEIVLDGEVG
jgi:putative serine protease PepD